MKNEDENMINVRKRRLKKNLSKEPVKKKKQSKNKNDERKKNKKSRKLKNIEKKFEKLIAMQTIINYSCNTQRITSRSVNLPFGHP